MRCPTLADLPPPPPGKTGWPWTIESPQLPDAMPNGKPWPRISIVTPSYNQGQFIEETIRSVLLQGYPNLEYIVVDGGSADDTPEVLEKYKPFLAYCVSEPDEGQAHAINKGFARATGDIGAYLNSDDYYCPNILGYVGESYARAEWDLFIGRQAGAGLRPSLRLIKRNWWKQQFPLISPFLIGERQYAVSQESTFWSLHHVKDRKFDDRLRFCLDVDWYCKIARGAQILLSSKEIGFFRIHPASKTSTIQHVASAEIHDITKRELGLGIDWRANAVIKSAFTRSRPGVLLAFLRKGAAEFIYRHPN